MSSGDQRSERGDASRRGQSDRYSLAARFRLSDLIAMIEPLKRDPLSDPSYRPSRTIVIDDDESSVEPVADGTFDRTRVANLEAYRRLNTGVEEMLRDPARLESFLGRIRRDDQSSSAVSVDRQPPTEVQEQPE
jgi:hypothetical protein